MEKSIQYLVFIKLFLSFHGNNLVVDANPLIGMKVALAKYGEFPFVVSLGIAPATVVSNNYCAGTLIAKNYVLTSAHCTINDTTGHFMDPARVLVTVGSNDAIQGTKYNVKGWITFDVWAAEKNITPELTVKLFNDIAIVELAGEVTGIEPAHVSNLEMNDIYGKTVVAAGWGIMMYDRKPRFLQKANLQVLNKEQCLQNLRAGGWELSDVLNHLCTSANPPISLGCGDSGGPILINGNEVVGVSESDCATHNDPYQQNRHTSVKYYRQFISDFIDY